MRVLVGMLIILCVMQFAAFEYRQGLKKGMQMAAMQHSQDVQEKIQNAAKQLISDAGEKVADKDKDALDRMIKMLFSGKPEGGGGDKSSSASDEPDAKSEGGASEEEQGARNANEYSRATAPSQAKTQLDQSMPDCTLLSYARNRSSCKTSKDWTEAELSALMRLFDSSKCKHPSTREIMDSVPLETLQKIAKAHTTVITYGTNDWAQSKNRACLAAQGNALADDCIAMGPESIDTGFKTANKDILEKRRGGGLWLWKPYIVNKTLASLKEGDYLIYHDAGAYFTGPVHPLLALMESGWHDPPLDGVLTFGVGFVQARFCKRDAFIKQSCDTEACHTAMQVRPQVPSPHKRVQPDACRCCLPPSPHSLPSCALTSRLRRRLTDSSAFGVKGPTLTRWWSSGWKRARIFRRWVMDPIYSNSQTCLDTRTTGTTKRSSPTL